MFPVHAILEVRASPLFSAGGRTSRIAWTGKRRLSRKNEYSVKAIARSFDTAKLYQPDLILHQRFSGGIALILSMKAWSASPWCFMETRASDG